MPRSPKVINFIETECAVNSTSILFCLDVYGLIFGENRQNIDYNNVANDLKYIPTGSSLINFLHYGQLYKNGFRMYDHGKETNLKFYRKEEPPFYPLENVRAPVALFYSINDAFISETSAQKLGNQLPNLIINRRVDDPKFTHFDYVFGSNAKDAVHYEIVKILDSI